MATKTFENEEFLPKLPLPSLEETCKLYLNSVRPLVDDEAYKITCENVEKFMNSDTAIHLQEKLEKRAQETGNWLEDYWLSYGYLKNRNPLLFTTNFAGNWITPDNPLLQLFKNNLGENESLRCKTMGALLHQVVQSWQLLRQQTWPCFVDGQGKKYSMDQFSRFFNTSRIPCENEDKLDIHFKTEDQGQCPDHVVVLFKGQFYKFSTLDSDGKTVSSEALSKTLQSIEENSQADESCPAIGVLAGGQDRDSWSQNYNLLKQTNPQALELINSAICMVILSDLEPQNDNELLKLTYLNDAFDIWPDKSLTFVAFKNGAIGSQSEHSPFDGMVSAEICGFCLLGMSKWKPQENPKEIPSQEVQKLAFQVPKELKLAIPEARTALLKQAEDLKMNYFKFSLFGKEKLKVAGIHPDAFMQVMLQVAIYKTHGKSLSTYETATTRQFYHGRTETVRSCTLESMQLAKLFNEAELDPKKIQSALKAAISKHLNLMEICKSAKGCDRHLFGLKIAALENNENLPDLFLDPAFKLSGGDGNFAVSTSLCGYSNITGACGPMIHDGYGVFYAIPNKSILIWITSWESSQVSKASELKKNLFETFEKIGKLLFPPN